MNEKELKLIENLKPIVSEYKEAFHKVNELSETINRICRIIISDKMDVPHDYFDGIQNKIYVKVCPGTLECTVISGGYIIKECTILFNGVVTEIEEYSTWRNTNE